MTRTRRNNNHRTMNTFECRYHLLAGSIIALLCMGITPNLSYLPMVEAFNFKLSQLLYNEEDTGTNRERPSFPRRDLEEEFGEQALECLVDSALGLVVDIYGDEGVCLSHYPENSNGHVDNGIDSDDSPSASPTSKLRSKRDVYGVDESFPMHYSGCNEFPRSQGQEPLSTTTSIPLDDRKTFYNTFIEGCRDYYRGKSDKAAKSSRSSSKKSVCDESEIDRFDMNLNQPPIMQNYTTLGFQKTKAPRHLMQQLTQFWIDNSNIIDIGKETGIETFNKKLEHDLKVESWYPGDTHTNHWEAKTYMLGVEDDKLVGGGFALKQRIWKAAESVLTKWIQTEADINAKASDKSNRRAEKIRLAPASLYGIRMYTEGAVLAPHVDRLPLVTSAIINVAQDVEEPWPLEVIGHNGIAYNVTLEPGDMLLYESHSVIHGRPFPLKGNYLANIFIHFEPESHCVRHAERMQGVELAEDAEEMYKRAQRKQIALQKGARPRSDKAKGKQSSATELPFFIQPDSYESQRWKQEIKYDQNPNELRQAPPPTIANSLASSGNLRALKKLAEADVSILFTADGNGWQPIHEAARAGNTEVLEYLIEKGADVNARTNFGKGANPVWWAEETRGVDHASAKILRKAGGKRIPPSPAI